MKHTTIGVAFGLALAVALPAGFANAQNLRSFVSAHGLDTNNCTLAAPCRTFAQALTMTNAGGEIDVLDPAGYGAMTITKAISIVNDGIGTAGVIVPSGGTGITINAGANDAVSLRGLSIEGNGVGTYGIVFNTGKSLTVENCVIRHVANDGIAFSPNATSSLSVSNSLVADTGQNGIDVYPSGSGAVTAVFNRVQVNNNNGNGIVLLGMFSTGTVKGTVYDSVAAGNPGGAGFFAITGTGHATTTLMVFNSVAANNNIGVYAVGIGATVRVAHSIVTGNASGWQTLSGGVLLSAGDNTIEGNTANETAPGTYATK